jgi:hypothetical protein
MTLENTEMTDSCCSRPLSFIDELYFQKDGSWEKIPYWVKFYFELGLSISAYASDNPKFNISLAIPTRVFASSLIASGINYGRSFIPNEMSDHQYVDFLLSLAHDTPVIYREGDIKYKAKIDRIHPEFYDGNKIIGLKIEKSKTKFVSLDKARRISLDGRNFTHLPAKQKGRKLDPPTPFINAIFGENSHEFTLESRLETLLFGNFNNVRMESSLVLSINTEDSTTSPGRLSDLLRPFVMNPKGSAYRSCFWPTNARSKPKLPEGTRPFVVIFDGAQAYFNWKDVYSGENKITILDKTERNFRFAVEQINNEFYKRSDEAIQLEIPPGLPGTEIMVFGEV